MGREVKTFSSGVLALLFALAFGLAACGEEVGDTVAGPDSTTANDVEDPDPSIPDAAEIPDGDGLAMRLTGAMVDGLLCPGGQRPCFAIDREVAADDDGRVRIVGRLVGDVVIVDAEEDVPPLRRDFPDECDGKNPGAEREEGFPALEGYRSSISDRYAIQWVSNTNVFHLGVTGDATDVVGAIDELGLGDDICVVGGFSKSEAELLAISAELGELVNGWPEDRKADGLGWAPEPFEGIVTMDLFQVDAPMLEEIAAVGDGLVTVFAAIEVLNGTLEDLEQALAESPGASPSPEVTMTCGRVTFPEIPADPDVFEPLDADAEAALEAMMAGPAGGEGAFFLDGYSWTIASRTDSELVLFGQSPNAAELTDPRGDPPYADMSFRRSDDAWIVDGFGQCRLSVAAQGLGPATVILDPDREPDPNSTELPVLINERSCASGQAPVDREIVPVVAETDTTVELTVLVAPVRGGANCQGNPFHPIVITLAQPLGERTVIDATSQPGQVRSWPPSQEDLNG